MANRKIEALPDNVTTLGAALRHLREQRSMTLRALADAVDVSAPFLSDVEHNRRKTTKLDELAKALECEPSLLHDLAGKISDDTKQWMDENPKVAAFLEELRESGKPIDEMRLLLRSGSSKRKRAQH